MNEEYLVPVYEPNHTYDVIVYDEPRNGTQQNGQRPARAMIEIPRTSHRCTRTDDVTTTTNSVKNRRFSKRCWIVTGLAVFVFCLILTLVNIILLLSIKGHQNTHTSNVVGVRGQEVNASWYWGSWGPCSAECGYGLRSRDRYCGNERCKDGITDKTLCNAGECEDVSQPVGFSAALRSSLENVDIGTVIVYENVAYNHGGGYDEDTGVFTCPVSGAYMFLLYVQGVYRAGGASQTSLAFVVDGNSMRSVVSQPVQTGQDETGGNAIVFYMNAGQKAWVETYYDDNQNIYSGRTTFTGVHLR